ncbi:hypothetical protein F5887DRAFT_356321 [Amanita rubescens]|nr:hypothetical protein F5887DRAFT_77943 [Amanita rubescens]KAF8342381.1 hypothetical protein F5887DRAFT_356321 [Amanita rubescens]
MLFLYSLLFFVLGTSVVALPTVSPPTIHLSRRAADEIDGYWHHGSASKTKRVIYIKDDEIVEASPKFSNKPNMDLYHAYHWVRATKTSVKGWKVPAEMLKKIPDMVEPSQAKERLLIEDGKKKEKGEGKAKGKGKGEPETLYYPTVVLKDGKFNFQHPTHWLKMNPNAIDLDKDFNPHAEMR